MTKIVRACGEHLSRTPELAGSQQSAASVDACPERGSACQTGRRQGQYLSAQQGCMQVFCADEFTSPALCFHCKVSASTLHLLLLLLLLLPQGERCAASSMKSSEPEKRPNGELRPTETCNQCLLADRT
jgi:hypothetical protein